jgi:hypothetical protein
LVVGHSNTVLEMIEAFGAKDQSLIDQDYDYLFLLTICKRKNKSQSHALRQPIPKEGAQMMR